MESNNAMRRELPYIPWRSRGDTDTYVKVVCDSCGDRTVIRDDNHDVL